MQKWPAAKNTAIFMYYCYLKDEVRKIIKKIKLTTNEICPYLPHWFNLQKGDIG